MTIEGVDPHLDTFLGLDISTNVGWCVMHPEGYQTGEEPLHATLRLSRYRIWLSTMVALYRPAVVFIEDVFINPNQSTKDLLHLHGVTREVLENCDSPSVWVGQSSAKAYVAHNGRMSSKEKHGGAMVRALRVKGYDVRGIDEADALAVTLTGMRDLFYPGRKRM